MRPAWQPSSPTSSLGSSHERAGQANPDKIFAAFVFIIGVAWLMIALESVTSMVLVAFFLAYILNPLTLYLQKWRIPRSVAAFVVVLAGVGAVAAILVALLPALVSELVNFAAQAPRYFAALHEVAAKIGEQFEREHTRKLVPGGRTLSSQRAGSCSPV